MNATFTASLFVDTALPEFLNATRLEPLDRARTNIGIIRSYQREAQQRANDATLVQGILTAFQTDERIAEEVGATIEALRKARAGKGTSRQEFANAKLAALAELAALVPESISTDELTEMMIDAPAALKTKIFDVLRARRLGEALARAQEVAESFDRLTSATEETTSAIEHLVEETRK